VGGTRFVLGYLYGILTGRRYNMEITLKIVESDKQAMVEAYNTHQQLLEPSTEGKVTTTDVRMPPLAFGTTNSPFPLGVVHDRLEATLAPGWHTFRTPVQFICAGKLPWLSRDSMMLPLAKNDGLIDVVIVPPRSAMDSLKVCGAIPIFRTPETCHRASTDRKRAGSSGSPTATTTRSKHTGAHR
jgi:sphingosine kinase